MTKEYFALCGERGLKARFEKQSDGRVNFALCGERGLKANWIEVPKTHQAISLSVESVD